MTTLFPTFFFLLNFLFQDCICVFWNVSKERDIAKANSSSSESGLTGAALRGCCELVVVVVRSGFSEYRIAWLIKMSEVSSWDLFTASTLAAVGEVVVDVKLIVLVAGAELTKLIDSLDVILIGSLRLLFVKSSSWKGVEILLVFFSWIEISSLEDCFFLFLYLVVLDLNLLSSLALSRSCSSFLILASASWNFRRSSSSSSFSRIVRILNIAEKPTVWQKGQLQVEIKMCSKKFWPILSKASYLARNFGSERNKKHSVHTRFLQQIVL